MGSISVACYKPRPGLEQPLLELVRNHLPPLRVQGLVTERAPIVDKRYFSSHPKFLKRAKIVVKAAIHLAQKLRINPIPFDGGARTNRT